MIQAIRDLVEYRELFMAFVMRDLRVRYKQTALGVVWVVLQPLITGVVFAAIFGLIRGQFSGADALLFFMAGLVPWTSFQKGVQTAAMSLEQNANLVAKVYFPRMTVPSAYVIASMVDFLFAFITLVAIAVLAGAFDWRLVALAPMLMLIQMVAGLGMGLLTAPLNAQYRDVKYIIPFVLQLGMFLTVWIPLEQWRQGEVGFGAEIAWIEPYIYQILSLNPMAAVVETFRAVLQGSALNWVLIGKGAGVAAVLLIVGVRFFTSRERRLVDIL
ncbi:MAG: ABC transporter permease [Sumerlaeia bacterium]